MVDAGISAEQGNEELLKDDEGTEETIVKDDQELPPGSKQEESAPADQEFRAELVKRFGEKPNDVLMKEVWEAYRNGETTFSQTQGKMKELETLVNQVGGIEALKQALAKPAPTPANTAQYPAKVQPLIDQGLLNPEDPIAQLLIDQERRLEQSTKVIGEQTYNSALQTLNSWLGEASKKYEYADVDAIRELALHGSFAGMSDAQTIAKIDELAAAQHNKFAGIVDAKTQAKLDELKNLGKKGLQDGKPGGGKPTNVSPKQAFNAEYSKHFKGDE